MPSQSTAETTAEQLLFPHAGIVSTCSIWTLAKPVPFTVARTWLIQLTSTTGPAPSPLLATILVAEMRHRSSEPTDMPTTRLVKVVPNFETAD